MEEKKEKTVVSVSRDDLENLPRQEGLDEEQSWNFLIPVGLPVLIVVLIIGVFAFFRRGDGSSDLNLDLSGATASGQVAGTQQKARTQGPKVPPSPSPSPSPSFEELLEPSPSPSPEDNQEPSSIPTPEVSPSPSQEASPSPTSTPTSSP